MQTEPPRSRASQLSMATHGLLLLLLLLLATSWTVHEAVPVQRDEKEPMKLCGRDFVRAMIFACGSSRWRRQWSRDILAHESLGEWGGKSNQPGTGGQVGHSQSRRGVVGGSQEWCTLNFQTVVAEEPHT